MLGDFTTHAQLVKSAPPLGPTQPAVRQLPAYCQRSTLTGTEFLHVIQNIIAHGDLNDIAFLEKELDTKFSYRNGSSVDGTSEPKIIILDSQHLLGNPISVHLYLYYQKSNHLKLGPIASLGFDTPSTFIAGCFHFSPNDISSHLGREFFGKGFGPGSTTRLYSPEKSSPAKNGSKIRLDFSYDVEEQSVNEIVIRQFH